MLTYLLTSLLMRRKGISIKYTVCVMNYNVLRKYVVYIVDYYKHPEIKQCTVFIDYWLHSMYCSSQCLRGLASNHRSRRACVCGVRFRRRPGRQRNGNAAIRNERVRSRCFHMPQRENSSSSSRNCQPRTQANAALNSHTYTCRFSNVLSPPYHPLI